MTTGSTPVTIEQAVQPVPIDTTTARTMADLVVSVLDRVQSASESLAAADAELPTGMEALDLAIGGLRGGDLVVLAGGPGSGKSSLALNIIRHIAVDAGCPTALVSLQSKGEHVLTRLASELSGIPMRRLNAGRLSDEEWMLLVEAARRLEVAPLLVTDQPLASIGAIGAAAEASAQRFGRCALVAIDHSHLLQVDSPYSSEWAATLRGLCRELKVIARRHDCSVLLIDPSDFRAPRTDLIPDADVIMELRRTGKSVQGSNLELCELQVLKQQHGAPCTVQLHFVAATCRFRSL